MTSHPFVSPQTRWATVWVCAINCAVSIVSTCLYYSELHHLHDFPFFTAQLNAAIGALLAWLWLSLLPKDPSALDVPLRSWLWLSALLALQNSLEVLSIARVGNDDLPPILQQAVVPLSLLFSWLKLGRSYTKAQLAGAVLVVAGVLAGFLPSLLASSAQQIGSAWVAVFLISRIPQACANIQAESLAGQGMSWPLRATMYTQLLAIPCNSIAALIASLLWKGDPAFVFQDYAGGFDCVFQGKGACSGAWASVLLFAVPGMLYTFTEFQVIQAASATAYFLLAALQLPLQDLALSALNSSFASFRLSMLPAVLAVTCGLMLYGLGSPAETRE
ncbi:unnamed protein product [Effrenium voratum]|nr:unnamed protein product [Effrenium voratum]